MAQMRATRAARLSHELGGVKPLIPQKSARSSWFCARKRLPRSTNQPVSFFLQAGKKSDRDQRRQKDKKQQAYPQKHVFQRFRLHHRPIPGSRVVSGGAIKNSCGCSLPGAGEPGARWSSMLMGSFPSKPREKPVSCYRQI